MSACEPLDVEDPICSTVATGEDTSSARHMAIWHLSYESRWKGPVRLLALPPSPPPLAWQDESGSNVREIGRRIRLGSATRSCRRFTTGRHARIFYSSCNLLCRGQKHILNAMVNIRIISSNSNITIIIPHAELRRCSGSKRISFLC